MTSNELNSEPDPKLAPEHVVRLLELQGVPPGSYNYKPLDGLRRLIAKRMTTAAQTVPHFSVEMRMELDALLTHRANLNSRGETPVSVNDFLIKAAALTLKSCPGVNVSYTDDGIITHHHADVAFAVAMDGGLVTPIIRRAEHKDLMEIASEARELAARGRIRRLKPHEYSGGSFSISNLGMYGVDRFNAIINQPQAAILSVGAGQKSYVFNEAGPKLATVLRVALTSDHRVIDGVLAAQWLQQFKALVENPVPWC